MLNTLRKFVNNAFQFANTAAINKPLLNKTSIEKLRHLAEKTAKIAPHQHEVAHRQYGDIRSIYRGYGLDYEESRPYQAGDEIRFMNWRLSARSDELYIKVFRAERRPAVFILVDRRQSMRFGSQTRLKVTQAARISAYLAFIAKQQNSPIAGVILNDVAEWLPEFSADTGLYNLLNQVNTACPPLSDDAKELSLDHILRLLLNMLVRGSIIYLVSDFHDLTTASDPILLQLAEQHQVHAIMVSDKLERKLPKTSGINILDPDTNEDIYLDGGQQRQAQFTQRATAHFNSIQNSFSQFNIPYSEIDTELDDLDKLIEHS